MNRRAPHAAMGFTAPTDIYEVMRQIDTSASSLNKDTLSNVADQAYRAAWSAWFRDWKTFFDSNYRTLKTLLHTDELKAQVEGYRLQLLSWYEAYGAQKTPVGTPVPQPNGIPPLRPPPGTETSGEGSSSSILPWWGWMLGGVAVVGLGYLGYRHYKRGQALAEKALPALFAGENAAIGAARGVSHDYVLSARDPDWTPSYARDPGYHPAGNPLRAESYVRAVETQHAPRLPPRRMTPSEAKRVFAHLEIPEDDWEPPSSSPYRSHKAYGGHHR